jgi:hypothetical protein
VISTPRKSKNIYFFRLAENGWKNYFYEYKPLPIDTVFILKQKEEIFKTKLYNPKTRGGIKRQVLRACIEDNISYLKVTFFPSLVPTLKRFEEDSCSQKGESSMKMEDNF